MTDHDFHTCWEPPHNRQKSHSEDEVETATCRNCGFCFQEPIDDDVYRGDHGECEVIRIALSREWLADRGYPESCEEMDVRVVHDL